MRIRQSFWSSLLHSEIKKGIPSHLRLRARIFLLAAVFLSLLLSPAGTAFAGSATWNLNPGDGDWNTATNWTPATVPNGPSDTATFASSNTTGVFVSGPNNTEVNGIVFNPGASAFTITNSDFRFTSPDIFLTISGVGITNNSGILQNFVATAPDSVPIRGVIQFTNSATAGNGTVFTTNGTLAQGGLGAATQFANTSSAGNGTFITNGCTLGNRLGGTTDFFDSATAGNGTFTTNGGTADGAESGTTSFFDTATAGNGTFTNNPGSGIAAFGGVTTFSDNATAGNGTFINGGASAPQTQAQTVFSNSSTAGNATFTNNAAAVSGVLGGVTFFFDTSTAGNGTFTNDGAAVSGAFGGFTWFIGTPTAENGTFINNGGTVSGETGGITIFSSTSTAGNATLIANGGVGEDSGGSIEINDNATGGTARVEVFGNGFLFIAFHSPNPPLATVGSIEGDGQIIIGAQNLTVGGNDLSTKFSGVITGDSGSLTKIGTGTLFLTNANTYTGGTIINGGGLWVNNRHGGSGTGSGHVQVNRGRLGGRGSITGAVTVGNGSGTGAFLAPGGRGGQPGGPLKIQRTLTFNSDATYNFGLNSNDTTADEVIANGVTINSGAQFSFTDFGTGTLPPGTVFTVIDNTAATPIAGTFSNLPDGSMFTINGNTYQANYEGGNGNNLTLTVVP